MTSSEENVNRIKQLLENDRRLTVRELEEKTGIPKSSIHVILWEKLKMRKLCARLVPHWLFQKEKKERVTKATAMAKMLRQRNALTAVVTGDESWFSFHQSGNKRQNMTWLAEGERRPDVCRPSFSSRKRMFTIFISIDGPVLVKVLEEGATINAEYYTTVILPRVVDVFSEHTGRKRLLHHDNASSHTARKTALFLDEMKVTVLPHPPYSPTLLLLIFGCFPS